ncbi:hypothetical protein GCM10010428_57190 [Actinosynnema pretiosum subsp. pretiosum]
MQVHALATQVGQPVRGLERVLHAHRVSHPRHVLHDSRAKRAGVRDTRAAMLRVRGDYAASKVFTSTKRGLP